VIEYQAGVIVEVGHGYLPSPVIASEEQGDNTDDICQNGYGECQKEEDYPFMSVIPQDAGKESC